MSLQTKVLLSFIITIIISLLNINYSYANDNDNKTTIQYGKLENKIFSNRTSIEKTSIYVYEEYLKIDDRIKKIELKDKKEIRLLEAQLLKLKNNLNQIEKNLIGDTGVKNNKIIGLKNNSVNQSITYLVMILLLAMIPAALILINISNTKKQELQTVISRQFFYLSAIVISYTLLGTAINYILFSLGLIDKIPLIEIISKNQVSVPSYFYQSFLAISSALLLSILITNHFSFRIHTFIIVIFSSLIYPVYIQGDQLIAPIYLNITMMGIIPVCIAFILLLFSKENKVDNHQSHQNKPHYILFSIFLLWLGWSGMQIFYNINTTDLIIHNISYITLAGFVSALISLLISQIITKSIRIEHSLGGFIGGMISANTISTQAHILIIIITSIISALIYMAAYYALKKIFFKKGINASHITLMACFGFCGAWALIDASLLIDLINLDANLFFIK